MGGGAYGGHRDLRRNRDGRPGRAFRELTRTPEPAACLDLSGELADCPTLRRLRDRSFVAGRHFTTYPYTNRAVFSLLSSLYPSNGMRSFHQVLGGWDLPGLPRALGESGYRTVAIFNEPQSFEDDEGIYRGLGISEIRSPTPALPGRGEEDLLAPEATAARERIQRMEACQRACVGLAAEDGGE